MEIAKRTIFTLLLVLGLACIATAENVYENHFTTLDNLRPREPSGPPYLEDDGVKFDVPEGATGYACGDDEFARYVEGGVQDWRNMYMSISLRWDGPEVAGTDWVGFWVRAYDGIWNEENQEYDYAGWSNYFAEVPCNAGWVNSIFDLEMPDAAGDYPGARSQVYSYRVDAVVWDAPLTPYTFGIDHVVVGPPPTPVTYYVNGSAGDDSYNGLFPEPGTFPDGPKQTIQAAINAANNLDTVSVAEGTYTGANNRDLQFNGKAITVQSEKGPAATIIDCENSGRGFYCFAIAGSAMVIDGFTITNGDTTDKGGGIHCDEGTMTVKNCVIRNCSSVGNGGGIFSRLSTDVKIINCLVHDNSSSGQGGGIFAAETGITVINCTVEGNYADNSGGGIGCDNNATAGVTNCIFRGNTATNGKQISLKSTAYPSTIIVEYCDVEGMQGDVYLADGCTLDWRDGNIGTDALFVTGLLGDYYLSQTASGQVSDSPCLDAGSDTAENLGLATCTTRTDQAADAGTVDMGYHYPISVPEEITITSITMLDDDVTIEWDAVPGVSYTAQHSPDMDNWTDVPVGETGTWTDVDVTQTVRFYRVHD